MHPFEMCNESGRHTYVYWHQINSHHSWNLLHYSFIFNFNNILWFIKSLFLYSHKLEEEFEWLKKSEVLYYSVEKKGTVSSQLKHYNPWSMKCHQQQLQRMKENAKHRNQYSILCKGSSSQRERQQGSWERTGEAGWVVGWFVTAGSVSPAGLEHSSTYWAWRCLPLLLPEAFRYRVWVCVLAYVCTTA